MKRIRKATTTTKIEKERETAADNIPPQRFHCALIFLIVAAAAASPKHIHGPRYPSDRRVRPSVRSVGPYLKMEQLSPSADCARPSVRREEWNTENERKGGGQQP